jgi:hypothetical protein
VRSPAAPRLRALVAAPAARVRLCGARGTAAPRSEEKKAKVTETEAEIAEAEALVRLRRLRQPAPSGLLGSRSPTRAALGRPARIRRALARAVSGPRGARCCPQIRRMDLEARSLPAGVKTPLLGKLRDYKARGCRPAPARRAAAPPGSAPLTLDRERMPALVARRAAAPPRR